MSTDLTNIALAFLTNYNLEDSGMSYEELYEFCKPIAKEHYGLKIPDIEEVIRIIYKNI